MFVIITVLTGLHGCVETPNSVEPRYNEDLRIINSTLFYPFSVLKTNKRNIKSWDQQKLPCYRRYSYIQPLYNKGFCYIQPPYNEVPL